MDGDSIRSAINNAKYVAKKSGVARAVQTWAGDDASVLYSVPADRMGGTGVTVHALVTPDGEVVDC